MAVTSLVLGILGLFTCGLTALFGLIFGIISLIKIKNNKGMLKGDGIALAGIIVSALFLLMLPIFAAMLLPALATAKARAQTINCVNNEKLLALGVQMYANDHTNQFPPSATWCDDIKKYVGFDRIFECPAAANPAGRCDYAFNAALSGMDESKVDPHTVLIFESDAGWNASGGADSIVLRHETGRKAVVAFADGSVQQIPQSQLGNLRWNP
jgi:prepilin-type processing-associated H-X9-DG protein